MQRNNVKINDSEQRNEFAFQEFRRLRNNRSEYINCVHFEPNTKVSVSDCDLNVANILRPF